ncbi:hypothetical protein LF1_00040 [Rubripirellula obstinata]|uniref:Uncharacterized protein n=1 Tax=Rubripirellula obstinata TaxID=406547 RepID=A0A5B1CB97_9BACT|nr:hypothetical protein LF1_59210 [Rubripirellula obstinata]KAA1257517.1 hypothetical protein LF1_00040 [Rubripirellula obstinata]
MTRSKTWKSEQSVDRGITFASAVRIAIAFTTDTRVNLNPTPFAVELH